MPELAVEDGQQTERLSAKKKARGGGAESSSTTGGGAVGISYPGGRSLNRGGFSG